jgi:carboxyl-terminal processing protease
MIYPDPGSKELAKQASAAKPAMARRLAGPKVAAVKGALRADDGLQGDERSLAAELARKKPPRPPRTCC